MYLTDHFTHETHRHFVQADDPSSMLISVITSLEMTMVKAYDWQEKNLTDDVGQADLYAS
jgi:hypothetical protein